MGVRAFALAPAKFSSKLERQPKEIEVHRTSAGLPRKRPQLLDDGSGKRGLGTGGEPSGAQRTCARSYLQLDITKPKAGRHGARGAGWQNKCPFWMSSTQWGKVETVGDEGAVSGYTCGAWATACALLWACGGRSKGTQISASRRGACVLICI